MVARPAVDAHFVSGVPAGADEVVEADLKWTAQAVEGGGVAVNQLVRLYEREVGQADWTTFCGTNNPEKDGCVETANAGNDMVLLRDSKRPDLAALRFTEAEMASFVTGYARENNISL